MTTLPKPYVLLTRPACGYCFEAKELLKSLDLDFLEINIYEEEDLKYFMIANGLTTVPQVYHYGQLIGGYDDLRKHLESKYASTD